MQHDVNNIFIFFTLLILHSKELPCTLRASDKLHLFINNYIFHYVQHSKNKDDLFVPIAPGFV